ncbi:MAG: hypothetical protein K6G80_05105 [Treponema sp.]|nr:hypothetical protein [Treponema sp.]
MNSTQWQAFEAFRTAFKEQCAAWNNTYSEELVPLQKAAAEKDTPAYPLETAVVYNKALDALTPQSRITYIVIGDNPGKDEQLAKNNRYLVGQSGKLAQGFFARNAEFKTDFRENVIILNKTPVHTAKTAHLHYLAKNGGERIRSLIAESTLWMAKETARLHQALCAAADGSEDSPAPELWLVGYTELKNRRLFTGYCDALKAAYADGTSPAWQAVRVFMHFSMNQFSNDLKKELKKNEAASSPEPLTATIERIGLRHRTEIFG